MCHDPSADRDVRPRDGPCPGRAAAPAEASAAAGAMEEQARNLAASVAVFRVGDAPVQRPLARAA